MAAVTIAANFVAGQPFARIPVILNGEGLFEMFFDTVATRSVITPRVAQELGLRVRHGTALIAGSRTVDAGRTQLSSLQLGSHEVSRVTNFIVRVIDLPVSDGALGLDYLSRFARVCYDFHSHALELTTR